MTNSQKSAIERLRQSAIETALYSDKFELKKFEITENEFFVTLIIETGIKDDEGTMAYYTREHAMFFIYKRGRIMYPVNCGKRSTTKHFDKFDNFLTAAIAQKYI